MGDLEQRLAQLSPLQRAVLALKETQQRLEALERQRDEPIALIGVACRFPGGANDPEAFWKLLCDEAHAIREVPADRWDVDAYYDPNPAAPGKTNSRWGGFLDGIDLFDNHFFSISDREATRIDPQHRMTLELTWEALENAGIPPSSLRGSRTGVFVGMSHSEYGIMLSTDMAQSDAYVGTGTAHCLSANRVSFMYDFHGPSVMLDTACSSSLVAVHLACQALRTGDAEVAIAGGVNIVLSPLGTVNLTKAGFTSSDGRVRAFDAAASGYVRSEGGGLIVLKPLSAAQRDNDRIYAVIRGSAVNQNGFSNGLTAPSRPAQETVLRQAYAAAKIAPSQVQYVETQGTGTRLGDAVEALSLGEVLGAGRAADQRFTIGSVKTNIGHLEAASGAASLIKVALALEHGEIPSTINFTSPSPDIPFAKLPLAVQTKRTPWPTTTGLRAAGVSAFGFGGSNAHLVVTEPPAATAASATHVGAGAVGPKWLTLSARTEQALQAVARQYVAFLRRPNRPEWSDICYTAAARRDHHDCRLALRADSADAAAALLEQYLAGAAPAEVLVGRKPYGRDLKIALVLGDFSAAEAATVRTAISRLPEWAAAVADVDEAMRDVAGWTLSSVLLDDAAWQDAARRTVATTALQLALVNWCRGAGMTPALAVGSGTGEIAVAAYAGILSAADALRMALAMSAGSSNGVASLLKPTAARQPGLSATNGKPLPGADLQYDAWRRQMANPADWASVMSALKERQVDVAIGLGEATKTFGGSAPAGVKMLSLSSDASGATTCESTYGPLYVAGASLRWALLQGLGHLVTAPTYPWQKHRLWADRKDWLQNAHGRTGSAAATPAPSVPAEAAPAAAAATTVVERRERPDLNTPYEAPRTPLEHDLANFWCEILKIDRVGVHDNFFELGGDSLQAMILHNSLQDRLGEVVLGYVLFQAQTIDRLAEFLRRNYSTAIKRLFPEENCEAAEGLEANKISIGPAEMEQVRALVKQYAPPPVFPVQPGPKNPKAVFVFSPPRSGSTLLRVMLAGHPRLFSPPELELLSFPTLMARKQAYAGVPGQWLEGAVRTVMEVRGCGPDEARQIVTEFEDQGRSVKDFYRLIQDNIGDRLMVDKTPGYSAAVEFMRQAEELFDEPLYVQLLRHPCGMMRSYVEYHMHVHFSARYAAGMEVPFTPYQLAEITWILGHENIETFFKDVPEQRRYRMRFEDVVTAPETSMRGLCDFLGMDYHEEMIHPYEHREKKMLDGVVAQDRMYGDQKFMIKHKSIDPTVANAWREHLSADMLGSVSRNLALSYGYTDVKEANGAKEAPASSSPIIKELVRSQADGDQAEALLGRLDELSDAEVAALLQQHQTGDGGNG